MTSAAYGHAHAAVDAHKSRDALTSIKGPSRSSYSVWRTNWSTIWTAPGKWVLEIAYADCSLCSSGLQQWL